MKTHTVSRRDFLATTLVAVGVLGFGSRAAFANLAEEEIKMLTAGAVTVSDSIVIEAPEIAENGTTVPVEVTAPGAVALTLFADGNPTPAVAKFKFGKLNTSRTVATRIRLAKSQNVIAIAQMEDGSFQRAQANVKVTIGGCGG